MLDENGNAIAGPTWLEPDSTGGERGAAPRRPPPGPYGFLMLKSDAWLEIDRVLEARGPLQPGESVQLYASLVIRVRLRDPAGPPREQD
ncbi:MAG: hypothetical protein Q8N23_24640 [Archangium sp.]|nr:hypothetical protein [Archangium sp.]MDP3575407.1 hypothetical protein [Archangium sp.]